MKRTTKLLGAWGGVAALALGLIGELVPGVSVLSLLGSIAGLTALFRAAAELQRPAMRNALIIWMVLGLLSGVAFLILAGSPVLELFKNGVPDKLPEEMYRQVGLAALAAWLLFVASAWYWFRALDELARATGVPLFRSAGLVYFVGAVTLIVVVGMLALLASQVMQIMAFFKVAEQRGGEPPLPPAAPPPPRSGGWGPKV